MSSSPRKNAPPHTEPEISLDDLLNHAEGLEMKVLIPLTLAEVVHIVCGELAKRGVKILAADAVIETTPDEDQQLSIKRIMFPGVIRVVPKGAA